MLRPFEPELDVRSDLLSVGAEGITGEEEEEDDEGAVVVLLVEREPNRVN